MISAWFSGFEIFENYTKGFLFPNSFVLILGFSKEGSLNEKKMLSLILYSRVKLHLCWVMILDTE